MASEGKFTNLPAESPHSPGTQPPERQDEHTQDIDIDPALVKSTQRLLDLAGAHGLSIDTRKELIDKLRTIEEQVSRQRQEIDDTINKRLFRSKMIGLLSSAILIFLSVSIVLFMTISPSPKYGQSAMSVALLVGLLGVAKLLMSVRGEGHAGLGCTSATMRTANLP